MKNSSQTNDALMVFLKPFFNSTAKKWTERYFNEQVFFLRTLVSRQDNAMLIKPFYDALVFGLKTNCTHYCVKTAPVPESPFWRIRLEDGGWYGTFHYKLRSESFTRVCCATERHEYQCVAGAKHLYEDFDKEEAAADAEALDLEYGFFEPPLDCIINFNFGFEFFRRKCPPKNFLKNPPVGWGKRWGNTRPPINVEKCFEVYLFSIDWGYHDFNKERLDFHTIPFVKEDKPALFKGQKYFLQAMRYLFKVFRPQNIPSLRQIKKQMQAQGLKSPFTTMWVS